MRLILIGCEYVGKTTLANALEKWGLQQGRQFHMDDSDFSIPDQSHLDKEEQQAMVKLPPKLKERFQRFQVYYHVDIVSRHEDCILGGFHIEEAIYGPRYYYPGQTITYQRRIEPKMPPDTILALLMADPDVVRARMQAAPHPYQLVGPDEVEEVQDLFEAEFTASWLTQKFRFDTSDFQAQDILDRFLEAVRPHLSDRDLLLTSQTP